MSTATTSNNKRKRSDDEQQNSNAADDHHWMWNLPEPVQYSILSFLPRLERLPLTLTCKSGRTMVEEYSEKVMDKIYENHFVDDDFEQRLAESSSCPSPLPHRVRLKMALHSHLYKISRRRVIPRYGTFLKLSPCERYLLLSIANDHDSGILSLWNLDTRRGVRGVWAKDVENGEFLDAFFVVRETVVAVVACQRQQITVYGMMDGEVTARHALPQDQQLPQKQMLDLIQGRFLVYSAPTNRLIGRLDLSVFDVFSGVHRSVSLLAQRTPPGDPLLIIQATCVLANRWLVVVFGHWLDDGTYFRIYDGQDDGYTQRAGYHSEHQYDSTHGFQGDTLAARRKSWDELGGNTIDVFKFNEETFQFYLSSTFDVDPRLTRTLGIRHHALHLHGGGRQWSMDRDYPNPTDLFLYNMETGEQGNKYYSWHTSFGDFGATDCVVSPAKQELLVGIRRERDDEVPDGERNTFLAAFLLKEPLLED